MSASFHSSVCGIFFPDMCVLALPNGVMRLSVTVIVAFSGHAHSTVDGSFWYSNGNLHMIQTLTFLSSVIRLYSRVKIQTFQNPELLKFKFQNLQGGFKNG